MRLGQPDTVSASNPSRLLRQWLAQFNSFASFRSHTLWQGLIAFGENLKQTTLTSLAGIMIAGFFFCAVFGIFGSNSLTPLGLYSLAAIQLLFLAFGCLFNNLKEHREIAADYPGKNFAKPRRDFAISSILGSSGVIALAAAIIFVCISFVKPETYITIDGKTYYIRSAGMSGDCRYTQAENLFFLESWQPSTAGYSAQSCSDVYSMLDPTQSPTYPDSLSTAEPSVIEAESTPVEGPTTPPLHTPANHSK